MKIVHICISAPYIDGWGYQANLLPDYLNHLGTENYVIASFNNFPSYLKKDEIKEIQGKGEMYKYNGTTIYRIKTHSVSSSFIIPRKLMKVLKSIKPDIIFHHNINSTSLPIAARYSKKFGCLLYVDNHADEINMSKNKLWVALYHKIIVRTSCRLYNKSITKYFGVTKSRCDFISKFYKVDDSKIELLPIGADTKFADTIESSKVLREKYGFSANDYIIVTGGKMGKYKGTDILIEAINKINTSKQNVKLILFGKYEDSYTQELAESMPFATQYGWCDRKKTLELLKLSDVACWPIHHTTLIEDAISVNTPLILRKTGTTEHLIDGNGVWINEPNEGKIISILESLINQDETEKTLMKNACEEMKNKLSYLNIASRIINHNNNM